MTIHHRHHFHAGLSLLSGLLLLTATFSRAGTKYRWSNDAGKPGGPGYANGAGAGARFYCPFGTALDPHGNLYVTDFINADIRKITPTGIVTTFAGKAGDYRVVDGPRANARFDAPAGVAMDGGGNLYVTENQDCLIRKITPDGTVSTLAGKRGGGSADGLGSAARFIDPVDLVADSAGNLYVADSGNSAIRKITPDGMVTTLAGKKGHTGNVDGAGSAARFDFPYGICFDASSQMLYVTDAYAFTIRRVSLQGAVTTVAGVPYQRGQNNGGSTARFHDPNDIATDGHGNFYVADDNLIRKISPPGMVSTLAGLSYEIGHHDGPGSKATFWDASCLSVDSSGNIYASETSNSDIRKISPTGMVTTLAGQAENYGFTDGVGKKARFDRPESVVIGPDGTAYVGDRAWQAIRMVSPDHTVSTLALTVAPDPQTGGILPLDPKGLALDASGNLYIANGDFNQVLKVTPTGETSLLAGDPGGVAGYSDGTGYHVYFHNPTGIAVDAAGTIYVADTDNEVIRTIAPDGSVATLAGLALQPGKDDGPGASARFNQPTGLAAGSDGTLYVTDSINCAVRKVAADGTVSTLAGKEGVKGFANGSGALARFTFPYAITIDVDGDLLVTDCTQSPNNWNQYEEAATVSTIRRVTTDGQVTTIGGRAGVTGGVGGIGQAAQFCQPWGLAVDASGNIYVADGGNNRISIGRPTP